MQPIQGCAVSWWMRSQGSPQTGNLGLDDFNPVGIDPRPRWRNGVARRNAVQSPIHERHPRSIIQPRVFSSQRNYPGSIPNQAANPERVEFSFAWSDATRVNGRD